MGLDLVMYAENKKTKETEEIAYGRKTWCIANFFRERCPVINEEMYKVRSCDVFEFFYLLRDVAGLINEANKDYDEIYNQHEYSATLSIMLFEHWYDNTFDDYPTLGYDWDCAALVTWYKAIPKIFRYAQDDDYDLILIASY